MDGVEEIGSASSALDAARRPASAYSPAPRLIRKLPYRPSDDKQKCVCGHFPAQNAMCFIPGLLSLSSHLNPL